MVFLRKNILVEHQADPDVRYVMVSLTQELVKEFVRISQVKARADKDMQPITVTPIDQQLSSFIDSLHPYINAVEGPLAKIKLLELLFNLSRFDNMVLAQLMDLRQQYRPDITSTVEDNINNSLSLHQLAVLSGRSLSSFRRDFLAIYNMPPSQWIRQRRLEKARELLLNTTMTVTDVCYTLGFENLPHFSRLFKSYFGHPPSEFKLMAQAA